MYPECQQCEERKLYGIHPKQYKTPPDSAIPGSTGSCKLLLRVLNDILYIFLNFFSHGFLLHGMLMKNSIYPVRCTQYVPLAVAFLLRSVCACAVLSDRSPRSCSALRRAPKRQGGLLSRPTRLTQSFRLQSTIRVAARDEAQDGNQDTGADEGDDGGPNECTRACTITA